MGMTLMILATPSAVKNSTMVLRRRTEPMNGERRGDREESEESRGRGLGLKGRVPTMGPAMFLKGRWMDIRVVRVLENAAIWVWM